MASLKKVLLVFDLNKTLMLATKASKFKTFNNYQILESMKPNDKYLEY